MSHRVVLGMTLYNGAPHLREAMDSLLAQSHADFRMVLLDDASTDATGEIGRDYQTRDRRVRYYRHETRQGLIATWREVVDIAARDEPPPEYFAWVSDHDRWHPEWLTRLLAELDAHPEAVLAYPITQRITENGGPIAWGPRLFQAAGLRDPRLRWARFCSEGVGSGDMIYGLMRLAALRRAGTFRSVLRPDRLLIAEMSLQGEIRQVPAALWFRRQFARNSISRQRQTLLPAGAAPRWFAWPPVVQHSWLLYRVYARPVPPPLPIGRREWAGMIAQYQFAYASRHLRKSSAAHALERTVDRVNRTAKLTRRQSRRGIRNGVERLLVARRRLRQARRHALSSAGAWSHRTSKEARSSALGIWAGVRRLGRRSLYHVLVLTHRAGVRGRGETRS